MYAQQVTQHIDLLTVRMRDALRQTNPRDVLAAARNLAGQIEQLASVALESPALDSE